MTVSGGTPRRPGTPVAGAEEAQIGRRQPGREINFPVRQRVTAQADVGESLSAGRSESRAGSVAHGGVCRAGGRPAPRHLWPVRSPCPRCKASLGRQNTRFPTSLSGAWERNPPGAASEGPSRKQGTARPRGSWGARGVTGCPQRPLLLSAGLPALRWGLSDPLPAPSLRGVNQASVLSLFSSPLTVRSESSHSHTTRSKVSQA